MSECDKYQEMISQMLDGELPEPHKTELVKHLGCCPDCRRVYDAFSAISLSLGETAAPEGFAGKKVLAVRDYKKGVRMVGGAEEKLDYPASDVLFYELEGGAWVCIRPSGTEPKVKVYVNAVAENHEASSALTQSLLDAAVKFMNDNMD